MKRIVFRGALYMYYMIESGNIPLYSTNTGYFTKKIRPMKRGFMNEIRSFPRLSLSCDIQYKYMIGATPAGSDNVQSKTKDLSQGGICLITSAPLVKDAVISLSFKLHGSSKLIEVYGKVAWTQAFAIGNQMGYDNGIEFTKVSDEDREIIEKYIKSMFPS
jgi:hypothetical protein